jgi:hypothetical protein
MTSFVSFARRRNRDSSLDSICTKCYQTVASARYEHELETAEKNHICDPNWMFRDFPLTFARSNQSVLI